MQENDKKEILFSLFMKLKMDEETYKSKNTLVKQRMQSVCEEKKIEAAAIVIS